ncbi:hypothetical protein [Streptomyces kaniharaensis]|nr:hypothetical protein [Streptomyces kaniharaensis]
MAVPRASTTAQGNYSDKVTHRTHLKPAEALANDHHISGYVSPPGA